VPGRKRQSTESHGTKTDSETAADAHVHAEICRGTRTSNSEASGGDKAGSRKWKQILVSSEDEEYDLGISEGEGGESELLPSRQNEEKMEKVSRDGHVKRSTRCSNPVQDQRISAVKEHGNGREKSDKEDFDSRVIGSNKLMVLDKSRKISRRTCTSSGEPKMQLKVLGKPLKYRAGRYQLVSPPKKLFPREEPSVSTRNLNSKT
jgi:hypothetical protein